MNRYWFSQKQKEQHENHCSRIGSRKAEVLTDEGWKEYTQWCSNADPCPWDDAVLVAESKDKLLLRIEGHVQG